MTNSPNTTAPKLFPPMPDSGLRSFFTNTRWNVACAGAHHFRRRGWPLQSWRGRLSFTGLLADKERRA